MSAAPKMLVWVLPVSADRKKVRDVVPNLKHWNVGFWPFISRWCDWSYSFLINANGLPLKNENLLAVAISSRTASSHFFVVLFCDVNSYSVHCPLAAGCVLLLQQSQRETRVEWKRERRTVEGESLRAMDHHKVTLRNVDVLFPFKPYDLQVDYMRKVLQALQLVSWEFRVNVELCFRRVPLYFSQGFFFPQPAEFDPFATSLDFVDLSWSLVSLLLNLLNRIDIRVVSMGYGFKDGRIYSNFRVYFGVNK